MLDRWDNDDAGRQQSEAIAPVASTERKKPSAGSEDPARNHPHGEHMPIFEHHMILVISTAHLSEDTAQKLTEDPAVLSAEAQIMVYCGLDDAATYGPSLTDCIDWAKELMPTASYILFDRDGDTAHDLKTYDW